MSDTDIKVVSVALLQYHDFEYDSLSFLMLSYATEIQVSSQNLFPKSDLFPSYSSSYLTALPNFWFNNFFVAERFKLL